MIELKSSLGIREGQKILLVLEMENDKLSTKCVY